MEGIYGVTAACTPCRRRWQAARDGDGPADDLQPHILSANTLTPTSQELLMKTRVSSSSAVRHKDAAGCAAEVGDGTGPRAAGVWPWPCPLCVTRGTAARARHRDRPHTHGARCKHGPKAAVKQFAASTAEFRASSAPARWPRVRWQQQHLLPLPRGENSAAVLPAAPRDIEPH